MIFVSVSGVWHVCMRFDSAELSSDQHLPLQFITGILNSFLTMFQHVFIFASGKSKEAEIKRINKELANIRNKFKGKFVCINASWSAYYPNLFH